MWTANSPVVSTKTEGGSTPRRPSTSQAKSTGETAMIQSGFNAIIRSGLRLGYPLAQLWWHLTRPSAHGAHVVLRIRSETPYEDEILVVRHSYKPGLSVPCGGIHRGESAQNGALRELFEEVGIRLRPDQLLDRGEIFLIQDGRRDHGYFFECILPPAARPEVKIDQREIIWADFVPESRLAELDLLPHLQHYLEKKTSTKAAEQHAPVPQPRVAVRVARGH